MGADEGSVAHSRRRSLKLLRPVGALLALGALCAVLLGVSGASAKVVAGEGVSVGLQSRSVALGPTSGSPAAFANDAGNPVLPSSSVYAIYWDPSNYYHGEWQHLIDSFMHDMGASSGSTGAVFSVDGQYTDKAGSHASYETTFKGAYTDTGAYPGTPGCTDPSPLEAPDAITCISDAQLRSELQRFIAKESLPTGMGTVYYLLTPPGVTTCLGNGGEGFCSDDEGSANSFCSYHSYIGSELPNGGPSTILYAVIPWTAGGLGDFHLVEEDRKPAYECQDGGWDPSGEAGEERELAKSSPEAAHQQEPNQLPAGQRGTDGAFDTGLADLIVNQVAVEQQDVVTDPLLNGWREPTSGDEAVDECRNMFALTIGGAVTAVEQTGAGTLYNQTLGAGNYYLNDAFNLATLKQGGQGIPCLPSIYLQPLFTAPNVVNAGEIVGFDGSESNITLDAGQGYTAAGAPFKTYPTYHWSFGDGAEQTSGKPAGASVLDEPAAFHSYVYGGTYKVTLKVTDTGGNTASTSEAITVIGPPPPSLSSESPSSGSESSASTKSKKKKKHKHGKRLPRPVATAVVLTKSLPEALHKGLLVRYSVNQQVAGQFEVLIPRRLARRLHVPGPPAKGLPKGAKKQTVIAAHLLVTMRKAHGKLRILFPKRAKRRLRRLHHLKLTLRLIVRNASRHKPKATLVRTVVKLSR